MQIREYQQDDLKDMIKIWNEVVEEGNAFPQEELLDGKSGAVFFGEQTYTGGGHGSGKNRGTLHPSPQQCRGAAVIYAMPATRLILPSEGRISVRRLVRDCLEKAKKYGFTILQFNAVVESNVRARRLYERLGFVQLGTIPGGFMMKDGHYENICPYYILLGDK